MKFSNLKTFARLTVPEAKSNRVNDTNLSLVLNEVVRDINVRMRLLRTDEKFNVIAEQYKYNLSDSSETVNRFYKIDKMGLWWNSGTAASPNWRRLYPRTFKWLDKNFEGWRNQSSSDPRYFVKQGKYLILYPTPDTALTDGFWLYFIENTTNMSKGTDYPFGNVTEIPEYSTLTNVIMQGVKAWLKPAVGKNRQQTPAFIEYVQMCQEKEAILNNSLDVNTDEDTKITLPYVC